MGYGRLVISPEMLRSLLHLPEAAQVHSSEQCYDGVAVIVCHPELPDTLPPVDIRPHFTSVAASIELTNWGVQS